MDAPLTLVHADNSGSLLILEIREHCRHDEKLKEFSVWQDQDLLEKYTFSNQGFSTFSMYLFMKN